MTFYQKGWKTVTANISDLAAMGAYPLGFLVSIGMPADLDLKNFDDLVDGIINACKYYGTSLIGGDVNESSKLVLSGVAIGKVDKDKVLLKTGAEKGDLITVTGPLGISAAGTEILLSNKPLSFFNNKFGRKTISKIVRHALMPLARLKEGIILSKSGLVKAATDITDGLASELQEILKMNDGIGIKIYESQIPIPDYVIDVAKFLKRDPIDFALHYGEDFELLVIIKKNGLKKLSKLLNIYVIGEITDTGRMEIVRKNGKIDELLPRGYEHF